MRRFHLLRALGVCCLATAAASTIDAQSTNASVQLFTAGLNYSGQFGSGGSGPMQMSLGCGVAVNPVNNDIFISDYFNSRIEIWSATGQWIGYFGSQGTGQGQLMYPCGLAFAPNGNLYVVDVGNFRVQIYQPGNLAQTSWSPVAAFGQGGVDGEGGSAPGQFGPAFGIAIRPGSSSSNFTVYIVDTGNDRIQIFTANGNFISQFGLPGTGPGQFNVPYNMAFASNGDVLVADFGNSRIQRFTAAGNYVGQFGGTGQITPYPLLPFGIAVDPSTAGAPYAGRILVSDYENARVVVYNSSGNFVTQSQLHLNPNQIAVAYAIAVFSDGRVVVTDLNATRPPDCCNGGGGDTGIIPVNQ